jgi:quinohemoprotein ethanol dehydrogenase
VKRNSLIFILLWIVVLRLSSGHAEVNDNTNGDQWPRSGRAYDEAHFSPLSDINTYNVSHLGLEWYFDIPGFVLTTSTPLEIDGTLYFATGYSVVRALDAASGRMLWSYDPKVPQVAGSKLRVPWGIRGIASWNHKIYVGTQDGRLISINAKTGEPVWSVSTTMPGDFRVISGPPLAFNGKVMIGHGNAEWGPTRGYVTAYDAETGQQLWRFYTVPGDPKRGFENKAMEMAAKTWSGRWWKNGGGATVWNAMAYDTDLDRIYIGTGNGAPWSAKARSPGGGDNLFVSSIVALDAKTGAYVWHYQTNPAETWDYDATEDIELADVSIEGKKHRVLMQASKNGFFYLIDRETGKLISAEKFAKVTWADRIDVASGRPVETASARDETKVIWPHGIGAHTLQPMAFNPAEALVYVPVIDQSEEYDEQLFLDERVDEHTRLQKSLTAYLLAWDPVAQRAGWRIALPGSWSAGVATTAGDLVFQGRSDGRFVAYKASNGRELWSYDSQAGIVGAPITYKVGNQQYVSVLVGFSGLGSVSWSARTQSRRLLTFALGGDERLPPLPRHQLASVDDPTFKPNIKTEKDGESLYAQCSLCHGPAAIAGGAAPDLRESSSILSKTVFSGIVKGGRLVEQGMPRYGELSSRDLECIRQYVRARAFALTAGNLAN